jgi:hypothetical protein
MPQKNPSRWMIDHPMHERSCTSGSLSGTPPGVRNLIANRSLRSAKYFVGYQKACTRSNIVNAFRRARIATDWSGEHSALIAPVERSGAVTIRHWTFDKRRIPSGRAFTFRLQRFHKNKKRDIPKCWMS